MASEIEDLIQFEAVDVDMPGIHKGACRKWICTIVENFGFDCGDLVYMFCNDEHILSVNKKYLQHDYYTDIISFDYTENNVISGDMVISLDTVKSNSKKFGTDYDEELLRVIIHGVLHFCGFKDKTEADSKKMRIEENKALAIYNTL